MANSDKVRSRFEYFPICSRLLAVGHIWGIRLTPTFQSGPRPSRVGVANDALRDLFLYQKDDGRRLVRRGEKHPDKLACNVVRDVGDNLEWFVKSPGF